VGAGRCAGEVIVTAEVDDAASEIARHRLAANGETVICDDHYPPRRDTPERAPKPSNPDERAFLEIGEGAGPGGSSKLPLSEPARSACG
jgi:hypothetical protein